MWSKLLILAVCLCASAVQSSQILDKLTEEEIQKIFHRKPSEVPNFETVNVQTEDGHRSKRETRPVEFQIDGKTVQLKLNPAKHNAVPYWTPVWTVEATSDEPYHAYKKVNQEDYNIDGTVYQDPDKMATLLAYYKDSYIYYDGVFGESNLAKVVRSAPEKWWTVPDRDFSEDHIVYNVTPVNGTTKPIGGVNRVDTEATNKPLDTLYPKLLVVIEHNYFKKFGQDVAEVMRYLSTFWNYVNLQYSKISYPKVKIMITGVVIAKDDYALRYIYYSRNTTDMSKFNTIKLLNNQGKYFKEEFNKYVDFKNYDSTITLLDLDSGAVLGSAYKNQICDVDLNVGFMRDDASYDGLLPATHELGHLLSLPHDGQQNAKECKPFPEDGVSTIMSAYSIGVNKFVWSDCSVNLLRAFSRTNAAQCMKDQRRTRPSFSA